MAAKKDETVKAAEPEKKMYEIRLFKDGNKYKDDVFVGVNGKGYMIKRGERVMVPEEVKEVLENSMEQDEFTAKLIDAKSSEYEEAARKLGI